MKVAIALVLEDGRHKVMSKRGIPSEFDLEKEKDFLFILSAKITNKMLKYNKDLSIFFSGKVLPNTTKDDYVFVIGYIILPYQDKMPEGDYIIFPMEQFIEDNNE